VNPPQHSDLADRAQQLASSSSGDAGSNFPQAFLNLAEISNGVRRETFAVPFRSAQTKVKPSVDSGKRKQQARVGRSSVERKRMLFESVLHLVERFLTKVPEAQ
jgi:hypothetical protein